MHRVGYIFEKIVSMENLEQAVKLASRGKTKRKNVQRFMQDKERKLKLLRKHLIDGTYKCMPYGVKRIIDKGSGKNREIFVPKFYPDQIVQWALMIQIKSILNRGMYQYSCASLEGKGTTYGYRKVKKVLRQDPKNTKYCMSLDVRKFYPSIDKDILFQKLQRKIKDDKVLNLLWEIIDSVPSGVPIGNYTSQWFANLYLTDLDHFIKEELKIKYYIRYMDDLTILGSNKRKLHIARQKIENFLNNEKLILKPNWQVYKVAQNTDGGRAIDFLGFKFYKDFVLLRGRTFLRATRRIRKVSKKLVLTATDSSAMFSYVAKFNLTSGDGIYDKYVKPYICLNDCKRAISRKDKQRLLCESLLLSS